jgi:hypothetical protein
MMAKLPSTQKGTIIVVLVDEELLLVHIPIEAILTRAFRRFASKIYPGPC